MECIAIIIWLMSGWALVYLAGKKSGKRTHSINKKSFEKWLKERYK